MRVSRGFAAAACLVLLLAAGCASQSAAPQSTHKPSSDGARSAVPTSPHFAAISDSQLAACSLPATTASSPLGSGVDRAGRALTGINHERVVSVAMGAAESIAALGLGAQLVGRDLASGGADIASVPVVTDVHSVNAEKVLATHPTLVLIDDQTTPKSALDQIAAAGVQIAVIPSAWNVAAVGTRLRSIAAALGRPDAATSLISQCQQPFDGEPMGKVKVAFLYLRGSSAIYLVGGTGSGADSLISAAGAIDAGAQAGFKSFTAITPEAMATLKPDVLLVMTKGLASVGGVAGLKRLSGVALTPAAKAGRVVAVDDTLLLAFGSKTWALVDALSKAIADVSQ